MNEKDFTELRIRAEIAPQAARWPAGDVQVSIMGDTPTVHGVHWAKLHAVVDEARQRLSNALAAMKEIDGDADLSGEGKARRRRDLQPRLSPPSKHQGRYSKRGMWSSAS
jgi:hypothetical protein